MAPEPDPAFPHPSWGTLLARGFTKRCPRCGERKIYRTYFRMEDRCPRCGIRFEREPGFFVGAYLINFAAILVILFVEIMAFVPWKISHPDTGLTAVIGIGLVSSLVAPVALYPFARTVWSALDLGGTPVEQAEADDARAARGEPAPPEEAGASEPHR